MSGIFVLGKLLFSEKIGFISAVIFIGQAVFLAQSTFMLPETMFALFAIVTIIGYINKNLILEFVFGCLLVLTKESGVFLILSIIIHRGFTELIGYLRKEKNPNIYTQLVVSSVPLIVVGAF